MRSPTCLSASPAHPAGSVGALHVAGALADAHADAAAAAARADDDSWLNMPLLQTYLGQYDETLPFAIGWMWDRMFNETMNFFSGGSGMFFSQARDPALG
jgi:regulator of protease activity HflC (stomatin/prohibitin superfamily)